jgi:hypothetical protein
MRSLAIAIGPKEVQSSIKSRPSEPHVESGGNQVIGNEAGELAVEAAPGRSEGAATSDGFGQSGVKVCEAWSEYAVESFDEKDAYSPAEGSHLVSAGISESGDEPFAFETPEIVSGLASGVRSAEEFPGQRNEVSVGESGNEMLKVNQRSQHSHGRWVAESNAQGHKGHREQRDE